MTTTELDLAALRKRWDRAPGLTGMYPTATEERDYEDVHALFGEIDRQAKILARVRKLAKDHRARIKRMATKQNVEVDPDQALVTVHQVLQALGDKP